MQEVCSLVSTTLNLTYNTKLYNTLDYWSRDMLKFVFLEKDVGIVSPLLFLKDFSRKMFIMSYSINWPIFIAWFRLLLELLGNVFIWNYFFPGCDVINFEINLVFLIKPFFLRNQRSRQKFKYLEKEKIFFWNKKHFSLFLRGFQSPKIVLDLRVKL